jgi:DNA-binding beta-propeller fold protein YncE
MLALLPRSTISPAICTPPDTTEDGACSSKERFDAKKQHAIRFVSRALLLVTTFAPAPGGATVTFRPRSMVKTLSGNGLPGIAHGGALTSSYVFPVGVAVAPDDGVIVADAGANQIRRIAGGVSSLIAGQSSLLYDDAESWSGGYVDGPISRARFNRPTGVAVSRDGRIFVADNGNHCIREIAHGVVSTFAGGGRATKTASVVTHNSAPSMG